MKNVNYLIDLTNDYYMNQVIKGYFSFSEEKKNKKNALVVRDKSLNQKNITNTVPGKLERPGTGIIPCRDADMTHWSC